MKRSPNLIDFWRGVALASIFINHIPGVWFERFTHRNFGFSDSAELFVLLAGWSLRLSIGVDAPREGIGRTVARLGGRAVTLYAAQIVISMIALAMIATAAIMLDNPLILDWHNAGAVFHDPVPAHIGLVLLTHQLGYFDILPLYVVLIALAPLIAVIHRAAPWALLPVSFAIYLAALIFRFNAATWPVAGEWYFNPFAWQFIYVLGFLIAGGARPGRPLAQALPYLRWPALIFLLVAMWAWRTDTVPDPLQVPEPTTLFVIDKTYLSPLRLIHALALCAGFVAVYSGILRYTPWLARFGSVLGRNSLYVFCIGSLLSLGGQLVRAAFPVNIWVDAAVVGIGLAAMWGTAWLAEAQDRLRS
ncbi:OpgC domain-containing protein [Terrarubrum flagellatum]|uniref:OpgC family protein n=1 Tax=Terrirubrum flagellatum TaxID=2895980 RepID=UPI003145678B